jgi:hypothetical protein
MVGDWTPGRNMSTEPRLEQDGGLDLVGRWATNGSVLLAKTILPILPILFLSWFSKKDRIQEQDGKDGKDGEQKCR